jgi:hypothetical protein
MIFRAYRPPAHALYGETMSGADREAANFQRVQLCIGVRQAVRADSAWRVAEPLGETRKVSFP